MRFFLLSIRQPLGSTLFPYTTLFRSRRARRVGRAQLLGRHVAGRPARLARAREGDRLARSVDVVAEVDRKSTRLNSSHPSISYAVFCLKKKNNTIDCNLSFNPAPFHS